MSALILFIYLWLFYQSANTPLRDASVAALLPAAASSFTMVSPLRPVGHRPTVASQHSVS